MARSEGFLTPNLRGFEGVLLAFRRWGPTTTQQLTSVLWTTNRLCPSSDMTGCELFSFHACKGQRPLADLMGQSEVHRPSEKVKAPDEHIRAAPLWRCTIACLSGCSRRKSPMSLEAETIHSPEPSPSPPRSDAAQPEIGVFKTHGVNPRA